MYDPNHSFMWFNSDQAFTLSYITLTSNDNYETVDELNLVVHTIITTLETELCCFYTSFTVQKKPELHVKNDFKQLWLPWTE